MAENKNHDNCKFLISNFLKGKINWPKEIKIAKKLLKEYPEVKFWEKVYMDTYPSSLSMFLTGSGKKFLEKEFESYSLTKTKEPIKLEESPVINIKENKDRNKPKTLQQFIDEVQ